MSTTWFQLWVERQALDPSAWTAGHALQLLLGGDAPRTLARGELWEIDGAEAGEDASARFEAWARASNLFMNPTRDRAAVLRGSEPPGTNAATAHVVAVVRSATEARAHAMTLGHALGGRWRVRRGIVWTLRWPLERAAECESLAARAAWAKRRDAGLLVNLESQEARIFVRTWSCPALPDGNPTMGVPAGGESHDRA